MDEVIKMLEAIVSQGEAQFKLGRGPACINKETIEEAREVLTNHKPMTVQEAQTLNDIVDNGKISIEKKMMFNAYMIGQADANLAAPLEAVKESLRSIFEINI